MTGVKTIGIVGGGQLGRMLTLAAKPLGFNVVVLDPGSNCPAAQVGAQQIQGNLYDPAALRLLAKTSDVITIEIEHLDANVLQSLVNEGYVVHPAPQTISLIQDKFAQKEFLAAAEVAVAPFAALYDESSAMAAWQDFGGQLIVKARHGAYDGRGNFVVTSVAELKKLVREARPRQLYVEKLVPFKKELSVVLAKGAKGQTALYPVVETTHQRSICLEVQVPASISKQAGRNALDLAKKVAPLLKGAGVFAIEMFLTHGDKVLVNEIAPRVHNSGHHSIESCATSQFEQHIRAVAGLPLGDTNLVVPAAVMVNILGTKNTEADVNFTKALNQPDTHIHWYGKSPVKIDRKMGHITATARTVQLASQRANQARKDIKV